MTNLAVVEKTIEVLSTEKINSKFRLTPGRVNEVFEFLKIPFQIKSRKISKGARAYELENKKGESIAFNSMRELLYETPVAKEIKKRATTQMKGLDDFFSDLVQPTPVEIKGRKRSMAKAA